MKKSISLNKERRLYVIAESRGYSCLGFDVLEKRAAALAKELSAYWPQGRPSIKRYRLYMELIEVAKQKHIVTGWRSSSELHPQLIGLEGKRIEVIDADGQKYRFLVGKSTGFIPCHLQIHNTRSHGGPAVDSRPFKSIRGVK